MFFVLFLNLLLFDRKVVQLSLQINNTSTVLKPFSSLLHSSCRVCPQKPDIPSYKISQHIYAILIQSYDICANKLEKLTRKYLLCLPITRKEIIQKCVQVGHEKTIRKASFIIS